MFFARIFYNRVKSTFFFGLWVNGLDVVCRVKLHPVIFLLEERKITLPGPQVVKFPPLPLRLYLKIEFSQLNTKGYPYNVYLSRGEGGRGGGVDETGGEGKGGLPKMTKYNGGCRITKPLKICVTQKQRRKRDRRERESDRKIHSYMSIARS